jgi:hypothetical protein
MDNCTGGKCTRICDEKNTRDKSGYAVVAELTGATRVSLLLKNSPPATPLCVILTDLRFERACVAVFI